MRTIYIVVSVFLKKICCENDARVETMEPIDAEAASITLLPVEIVVKILEYLPAADQMRSRRVCRMWRQVMTDRDEYWRRRCARDFTDTYEHAHSKCHPPLTWGQLYHSLHLWTKLDVAKETWTKILENDYSPPIIVIYLYKDTIVLHKDAPSYFNRVYYLDKYTLKEKESVGLNRSFYYKNNLYITFESKSKLKIYNEDSGKLDGFDAIVENVHDYVVVGRDVYYIVCNEIDANKIFVCKHSNNYDSIEFFTAPVPICGLGYYDGHLHVLAEKNKVYKIIENKFEHVKDEHSIYTLLKYGFKLALFEGDDCYRSTKVHHNLLFTWTGDGVLSVYNKDVLAKDPGAEPIKKYDISDMMPEHSRTYISSIDVLEKENGHTIYVATSTRVFTLDLDH